MLGGLISEIKFNGVLLVLFFGIIFVLGYFFRMDSSLMDKIELVILVMLKIV